MSVYKNTYGIIGYDLTYRKNELLKEEFCESKLYDSFKYEERVGNIQVFDDPMNGDYLYFGYIFFETDESYESKEATFTIYDIQNISPKVKEEYGRLFGEKPVGQPAVIVFNEYT